MDETKEKKPVKETEGEKLLPGSPSDESLRHKLFDASLDGQNLTFTNNPAGSRSGLLELSNTKSGSLDIPVFSIGKDSGQISGSTYSAEKLKEASAESQSTLLLGNAYASSEAQLRKSYIEPVYGSAGIDAKTIANRQAPNISNEIKYSSEKTSVLDQIAEGGFKAGACDTKEAKEGGWDISQNKRVESLLPALKKAETSYENRLVEVKRDDEYFSKVSKQVDDYSKRDIYSSKADAYSKLNVNAEASASLWASTQRYQEMKNPGGYGSASEQTATANSLMRQSIKAEMESHTGSSRSFAEKLEYGRTTDLHADDWSSKAKYDKFDKTEAIDRGDFSRSGQDDFRSSKFSQLDPKSAGGSFDSSQRFNMQEGAGSKLPAQDFRESSKSLSGQGNFEGDFKRERAFDQSMSSGHKERGLDIPQTSYQPHLSSRQQSHAEASTQPQIKALNEPEAENKKSKSFEAHTYAAAPGSPAESSTAAKSSPINFRAESSLLARAALSDIDSAAAVAARPLLTNITSVNSEKNLSIQSTGEKSATQSIFSERAVSLQQPLDKAASIALTEKQGLAVAAERGGNQLLVSEKQLPINTGLLTDRSSINLDQTAKNAGARSEDSAIASTRKEPGSISLTTEKSLQILDLNQPGRLHTVDSISGKLVFDSRTGTSEQANSGKITGEKQLDPSQNDGTKATVVRAVSLIDPATAGKANASGAPGLEISAENADEGELDEKTKALNSRKIKLRNGELYLTGVELTVAALLAMGGAAKLKAEQNEDQDPKDADGNPILTRRRHLVAQGETLQSIAEDYYKIPEAAWLIADLNCRNLKETIVDGKRIIELKSRQELELPDPREVREFLLNLKRDFKIENLITFVSESTVDLELLNSFLGSVSGGVSETSTSKELAGAVKAASKKPEFSLPELAIDLEGENEDILPVSEGLITAVKELHGKVKSLVRRPQTSKLRTV